MAESINETDWRSLNRSNWDERVSIHLKADSYDLNDLRAGLGRLHPIEEAELGSVDGLRVLHLQCHFGRDTLTLAQRGAQIVGLDFSGAAIDAAREISQQLGLTDRASFVEADVYDAPNAIPEPGTFDLVFTTWGTITWLPDIRKWAQVIAQFLRVGGKLYLADGHPSALVFDDAKKLPDGMPGYYAPYFSREPLIIRDSRDYADDSAALTNDTTCEWLHPLGDIVTALFDAGLALEWFHEHDSLPWRHFETLVQDEHGMYRWPGKPWLPLAFSLKAVRTST
jgi:SAM-dependent methyltransferase